MSRWLARRWVAKLGCMVFGNPPGPWSNILGVPLVVVVLCLAIVGFIVGIVWLRRIFSVDDDSGDWWRFRR